MRKLPIHISLELELGSKSKVMGDESELREVLVNMVFNAVDAMPRGGKLRLFSENVGDSVVISVADSGCGMAPDVRSRIFDPFFTTKGKAGMGLGLAVSFGIIRRHEGAITVDSEVGQGTTFRITLPAAKREEGSLVASATSETATAGPRLHEFQYDGQLRLLVVDDEVCIRELLQDLLESEHCQVYTAGSGPEALSLFGTQKFDGVFTDVGMPDMSGWELASAIRQHHEKIPIAVITGWGEAFGSTDQKDANVNWVITKPFTADRISELVHEIHRQQKIAFKRAAFSIVAA